MLDTLRKGAGTWFVKIFLGILVLSFAVWGIGDIFRISPDPAVAKVGDIEISQSEYAEAYRRDLGDLQRRLGGNIDSEQARAFGLAQQTLNRLIVRALYDQASRDLGLIIGDGVIRDEIAADQAFKNQLGQFDSTVFEEVLRQNGYSEQSFVAIRRSELMRQQLFDSMISGSHVPKRQAEMIYRYQNQRRITEVLAIPHDKIARPEAPGETTLAEFHETRRTRYTAPELRALTFVVMRPEDLLEEVGVDPQEVRESYEARLAEFTIAEEREVEQILVPEEETAQKIAKRLLEGSDFYAVAKELAGQDEAQVKLGKINRGGLLGETQDIVFGLDEGEISTPVKSPFGWHVFRVTALSAGREKSFDEVKGQIEGEIRFERASDALVELTTKVEDALAGGAALEETAASFRLELGKIARTSAAGRGPDDKPVADLPPTPGFLDIAFQVAQGEEPLLEEAPDGTYFLVRVDEITAPALRPLAEVRDRVVADWQADEQKKAAEAKAEELAERVRAGVALAALGKEVGFESRTTEALTRAEAGAKAGLGRALVEELYNLKSGEVASGADPTGKSQLVVRLKGIENVEPAARPKEVEKLAETIRSTVVGDILAQFNRALETDLDVEINQRAADAIFEQAEPRFN